MPKAVIDVARAPLKRQLEHPAYEMRSPWIECQVSAGPIVRRAGSVLAARDAGALTKGGCGRLLLGAESDVGAHGKAETVHQVRKHEAQVIAFRRQLHRAGAA